MTEEVIKLITEAVKLASAVIALIVTIKQLKK
jgi:hypothetical protein